MDLDEMVLISIDDHIIEPADMFDRHMPAKYADLAPKYVHGGPDGVDHWSYQGQQTGSVGLNAVASWPHEEWGFDPVGQPEMRPGCYDLDLRVRDMDANGVLASMCFPTFAGFNGMSLARSTVDQDLTNIVVSAYNDWHIDELAGEHPGRFLPLGILPVFDPKGMVAEVERIAKKGCHAVSLPEAPYGVGLPDFGNEEYWGPVFNACTENDVAICLHIGGSFGLIQRPPGAIIDNLIILAPQLSAIIATDLILAGTFVRHPTLKVALSEGGIGWIPFFLDRLDRHVWNHMWTGLKIADVDLTPTELWNRNFLGCFITDPAALRIRDRIGIDTIAWECDYPHSDSTWPKSPEMVWGELQNAGASDADIHKITWENAARFFSFDPFQHRTREQATVGGLRATAADVDTAETSKATYKERYFADASA
ncbi:MAG TPA: amidohydrolase family protein [Acidimicrobiia bacterium]|nr:amidohydrolase family protein [Acidimicrobiia bacterium]